MGFLLGVLGFLFAGYFLVKLGLFLGGTLNLIGLVVITVIYALIRWRIGFCDWDKPDGPLKSGVATLLLVMMVCMLWSAASHNQDSIRPVFESFVSVFTR